MNRATRSANGLILHNLHRQRSRTSTSSPAGCANRAWMMKSPAAWPARSPRSGNGPPLASRRTTRPGRPPRRWINWRTRRSSVIRRHRKGMRVIARGTSTSRASVIPGHRTSRVRISRPPSAIHHSPINRFSQINRDRASGSPIPGLAIRAIRLIRRSRRRSRTSRSNPGSSTSSRPSSRVSSSRNSTQATRSQAIPNRVTHRRSNHSSNSNSNSSQANRSPVIPSQPILINRRSRNRIGRASSRRPISVIRGGANSPSGDRVRRTTLRSREPDPSPARRNQAIAPRPTPRVRRMVVNRVLDRESNPAARRVAKHPMIVPPASAWRTFFDGPRNGPVEASRPLATARSFASAPANSPSG